MDKNIRLLIIEDNPTTVENLVDFLEAKGYLLNFAMDGIGGMHLVRKTPTDNRIPTMGDVKMDTGTFKVTRQGEKIDLHNTCLSILKLLMETSPNVKGINQVPPKFKDHVMALIPGTHLIHIEKKRPPVHVVVIKLTDITTPYYMFFYMFFHAGEFFKGNGHVKPPQMLLNSLALFLIPGSIIGYIAPCLLNSLCFFNTICSQSPSQIFHLCNESLNSDQDRKALKADVIFWPWPQQGLPFGKPDPLVHNNP